MNDAKRVAALGFFDGVHRGHATLLRMALQRAAEKDARPAMLTFDRHPDLLVTGSPVPLINSPEDRAYILRRWFGMDEVIRLPFDEATMHMPWADFVDWVTRDYGVCHFIVGDDFRFGFRGEGTAEKLRAYGETHGFGCDVMPQVSLGGVTVSSTYIRSLVAGGKMEEAGRFLGHPHLLTGTVQHGFHLGHTLGTPTMNLRFADNVIVPRHGVYAARVRLLGEEGSYPAVTNIGVRPTVGGTDAVSVESFLLDFDRDVYGREIVCELYAFLRPEKKFDSLDALRGQILADAARVPAVLAACEKEKEKEK